MPSTFAQKEMENYFIAIDNKAYVMDLRIKADDVVWLKGRCQKRISAQNHSN